MMKTSSDSRTCQERMGSVLYCLLRNCFEEEEEGDDNHHRRRNNNGIYQETRFIPPRLMAVSRNGQEQESSYHIVGSNNNNNNNETDCVNEAFLPATQIHNNNHSTVNDTMTQSEVQSTPEPNLLAMFIRQFGVNVVHPTDTRNNNNNTNHNTVQVYPCSRSQNNSRSNSSSSGSGSSMEDEILLTVNDGREGLSLMPPSTTPLVQEGDNHDTTTTTTTTTTMAVSTTIAADDESRRLLESPKSPLRIASTFHCKDETHEVPTISLDEVVLPGSLLQREMSMNMKQTLQAQEDECVICMEPFDASNPRMPTLCGCGENKTYFHLPCLYQWIDQNENCPSCRERLRWEEF